MDVLDLNRIGKETADVFTCYICKECVVEPIYFCKQWHAVCGVCIQESSNDCYCTGKLKPNPGASRLARNSFPEIPCRNKSLGCVRLCSLAYMLTHLAECEYRPVECPLIGKRYKSSILGPECELHLCEPLEVYKHLTKDHLLRNIVGSVTKSGNGMITVRHTFKVSLNSIEYKMNTGTYFAFTASSEFLLSVYVLDDILIWWVCINEVRQECENFTYGSTVEFGNNLVVGSDLPVYGIRYSTLINLRRINGAYCCISLNSVLKKAYPNKTLLKTDGATLTIVINLATK